MGLMETINTIVEHFNEIFNALNAKNTGKVLSYLKQIPFQCSLNLLSQDNRRLRELDEKHQHPKGVSRGEIYNFKITEGIGSELSNNHLCIIIQNTKGNIYSEKVNVVPMEGDGRNINPNYQMSIVNDDLIYGHLDKDPSRIIFSDILTYDKARIGKKVGKVKPEKMKYLNDAIKKQLSL